MNTAVISFRTYKNLKTWLEYAGRGFKSEGELLRLIVTKAALEQAAESSVSRLLKGMVSKMDKVGIGDTAVLAVRLPVAISEMVRECATKRGKSTSEWCALVLLDWWQSFHDLYEEFHGKGDKTWLARYATQYRTQVDNSGAVYAQKQLKQGAEVIK